MIVDRDAWKWIVVFVPRYKRMRMVIDFWRSRYYGHVFALWYDAVCETWMLVDPTADLLVVTSLTEDEVSRYFNLMSRKATLVLDVPVGEAPVRMRARWYTGYNCVSVVASLIGIRCSNLTTVRGLAKRLLRIEGTKVLYHGDTRNVGRLIPVGDEPDKQHGSDAHRPDAAAGHEDEPEERRERDSVRAAV